MKYVKSLLFVVPLVLNVFQCLAQIEKYVCPEATISTFTNYDITAPESDGYCTMAGGNRTRVWLVVSGNKDLLEKEPEFVVLGFGVVSFTLYWKAGAPPGSVTIAVYYKKKIYKHLPHFKCKWTGDRLMYTYTIHKQELAPLGTIQGNKTLRSNGQSPSTFNLNYYPSSNYRQELTVKKIRYSVDNGVQVPVDVKKSGTSYLPTPITFTATAFKTYTLRVETDVVDAGGCLHTYVLDPVSLQIKSSCYMDNVNNVSIKLSTSPTGTPFESDQPDKSFKINVEQPYYLRVTGITDFAGNFQWEHDGGASLSLTGNKFVIHKGLDSYRIVAMPKVDRACPSKTITVLNGKGNTVIDEKCTITLPDFLRNSPYDLPVDDIVLDHFATYVKSRRSIIVMPGVGLEAGAELIIEESDPVVDVNDIDKKMNFTEQTAYDDYGRVILSSRSYFNNNGKPLQTQLKNLTNDVVLANATLYDAINRPAISTLSAPVRTRGNSDACPTDQPGSGLAFGYKADFVTTADAEPLLYDYTSFDLTKETNPAPVGNTQEGTLGWYYSSNNGTSTDTKMNEPLVATTQYPYTRTLFKKDGSGAATSATKPGDIFKAGSPYLAVTDLQPVSATDNYLLAYLTVRETELGLAKPTILDGQFTKTVSTDGTGKKSVSYQDKSGHGIINLYFGTQSTPITKSYQFYDRVGRLIASISPNGLNQYESGVDYDLIDKTTYSYNSKGLLREMVEKDGGKTQYLYRKDGKIRFSQNDEQRKPTSTRLESFSYTNYDKSGRPVESGEYVVLNAAHSFSTVSKELLENTSDGGGLVVDTEQLQGQGIKRDQLFSYYDEPDALVSTNTIPALPADRIQHFVRGAVSWTMKDNIIKTWYSYDENGRMEWMVQYIKDAGFKTLDYRYGPTGQVQEVTYQKGVVKDDKALSEQFSHFYEYDLDGHLHKVYTTRDLLTYNVEGQLTNRDITYDDYGYISDKGSLELQATYQYYLHGPLKRVELANNLQGIDYLYTADGALKSINGADAAKDPGADGTENSTFRSDVFGMTLDYYTNDYVGANGTVDNVAMSSDYADQHTGLVKAMRWHSPINSSTQYAYAYSYDERNQFTKAEWGTVTANGLLIDPFSPYQEGVPTVNGKAGYDANGNINFLQRNGNRLQSVAGFNYDLTYNYAANSNKLQSINNDNQPFRSYQYNDLGQMTTETKDDKSSYITYDVTGKVTGVYTDLDHKLPIVTYLYDDKGFRLSKTNYTDSGSPGFVTLYVRDASGNVVGTYEDQLSGKGPVPTEIPIYGSGRIGLYKAETGYSFYELTDHLGNVRAVIGEQVKNETLATMEDQRSDDEADQFINPSGTVAPSYINHTPAIIKVDDQTINITTPPPGKVCRINNGIAGTNPIGVGQMLAVEPGDVIEAEVFVKYENYESDSYNPIDGAAGFLTTSFSTTGTDVATLFSSAVTPLSYIVPAVSKVDVNEPLAFLNYLLYDKYGQLVDHNNIQVSDQAEIRADRPLLFPHEKLSFNLNIEKGGFLYVYVSNLTDENLPVYFDDLRIKQTMSDIVAGGDYYPYGLTIGDRQIDRQSFRYGYQGKFAEKDDETGWNHFELREYDAVVGRWTTVDPKRIGFSPYIGIYNNPISGLDSDGGGPNSTHTDASGKVVAVYNDGDLGVYQHTDLSGWDGKSILAKSGKGIKLRGFTFQMSSFANQESFDESKLVQKVGKNAQIDFSSKWAYDEISCYMSSIDSWTDYVSNANNNMIYDIKTKSPGGVYYGSKLYNYGEPVFASARDAGNILAGAIARYHGIDYRSAFAGFGALQKSKGQSGGRMFWGGVYLIIDQLIPFLRTSPTYGEDVQSFNAIEYGYFNSDNWSH